MLSLLVQLSSLRAAPSALPSVREELFTEIVVRTIDQVGEPFYERVVELERTISKARCSAALERWSVSLVSRAR